MEQLLQVGVIASTHGLKGEVKVFPTTDDVMRFKQLKNVILDTGKEQLTLEIQGVKFLKKFAILKFKEIDDINEIEKYKGCGLFVERKNAVELKEDEYFIADMIGMKVITDDNIELGVLTEVMETGANDVYVIKTKENKEILIPAIKQCILRIDVDNQEMKVHLLEGLI